MSLLKYSGNAKLLTMIRKILIFALLFPASAVFVRAEQVITLKDGSQIKGELVDVQNGVYTVKSALLGAITVNADQVNSIASPEAAAGMNGQIQAAQTKIMANPQTMSELQELIQDPEITQMLSDPALIQAVAAKDPAAVQNNPNAQALMQNPKMRTLMEKLQQQKQN